MFRRMLAGAATGTALVLTLTGCLAEQGGSDAGPVKLAAGKAIQLVSQKTQQVDGFKANLSVEMQTPQGTLSMRGPIRYRVKPNFAFHMAVSSMSAPGPPGSLKGMHVMLVDDTVYVKSPDLAQAFNGRPWLKIDLGKAAQAGGVNLDELMPSMRQSDPIANTRMLTASKDAREVGEETIDGIRTRHYQGTYSVDEALAKLDGAQREQARKALREAGMTTVNFDVWVDGRQLPRKLVLKSADAREGSATVTVHYRSFSDNIEISPPSADKVADLSDLGRGYGGN